MREGFILYRSFFEALSELSDEQKGKCLSAISEYALYGNEPNLTDPVVRLFYTMAKPQIDANNKRFENGKKGGRPKTETKPKNNQDITKEEPKEKEKDKDKENVKDKDKDKLLRYGEFKNVCLTEEDFNRLRDKYGNDELSFAIEKLDGWLDKEKQKKKRNQNHRAYFKQGSWVFDKKENKQKTLFTGVESGTYGKDIPL